MSVSLFDFLGNNEFIKDLQIELSRPVKEICFIYFKINYRRYFKKLYPLLLIALESGAKVDLYLDGVFSQLAVEGLFIPLFGAKKVRNEKEKELLSKAFENLKARGAHVHYFNTPTDFVSKHILPFSGRDHRKFIYVKKGDDSSIAYFGACNLDQGDRFDFMLKVRDSSLSDELLKKNIDVWFRPKSDDVMIKASDDDTIIIDSGRPFGSSIYTTAINMIKKAKKSVVFVSQLPPEPHLMFYFILAKLNGASVEAIMPHFKNSQVSGFPYVLAFIFAKLCSFLFGIRLRHAVTGFTHAKVLLCDGRAILGSHNLSYVGVVAGTQEISLQTSNKSIVEACQQFVDKLAGNNIAKKSTHAK